MKHLVQVNWPCCINKANCLSFLDVLIKPILFIQGELTGSGTIIAKIFLVSILYSMKMLLRDNKRQREMKRARAGEARERKMTKASKV